VKGQRVNFVQPLPAACNYLNALRHILRQGAWLNRLCFIISVSHNAVTSPTPGWIYSVRGIPASVTRYCCPYRRNNPLHR